MPEPVTRTSCLVNTKTVARFLRVLIKVALALAVLPAAAQVGMIPAPCVGKTGEALDKCVRDITPAEPPRIYVKESLPDPRGAINCQAVNPADRNFCIARNQIIGECGNRSKYPDFDQCFLRYIGNPPLPGAADCSRAKDGKINECNLRNKVYRQCIDNRVRYFDCLAEKMSRK
jgi:hypothetical protein